MNLKPSNDGHYSDLIDLNLALGTMLGDRSLLKNILRLYCEERLMEVEHVKAMLARGDVQEIESWSTQNIGLSCNLNLRSVLEDLSSISRLCALGHIGLADSVYEEMLVKIRQLHELARNL